MTSQFLSERHAPTHSTLERCCMLKKMGYEPYIVATTEGSRSEGALPYYSSWCANRAREYDGVHIYHYGEDEFWFYQEPLSANMPQAVQSLLNYVAEVNPYFILYVGGQSYVADYCNEFCPVITVSTVFSAIPDCQTAFSMVGRTVTPEERQRYHSEIVEVPFTFELQEKQRDYTRGELQIPEQSFVMAVVGNRLDYDVDGTFVNWMEQVENGFLLFIGEFSRYGQMVREHEWLCGRSLSLGHVEDVLGVLECADLYVNPKRLGGGFSVIEAFHAGLPAVSLHYGDVATAAGELFCVDTYEEMLEVIRAYRDDPQFYKERLASARKRAEQMTDGFSAFSDAVRAIVASDHFY